jgi:hypothetical protein
VEALLQEGRSEQAGKENQGESVTGDQQVKSLCLALPSLVLTQTVSKSSRRDARAVRLDVGTCTIKVQATCSY